jgi:uncharacterized protein YlaI
MTRVCKLCRQKKELNSDNFRIHRLKNGGFGFRHTCRKCVDLQHIEWGRELRNLPIIMCQSAKHRAKRDGVPFEITAKDIVIPEFCPVFGMKLEQGNRQNHENAPSLDRIICEKGYVRGNIRVISHLANMLKSKATARQLRLLADYIDGHPNAVLSND